MEYVPYDRETTHRVRIVEGKYGLTRFGKAMLEGFLSDSRRMVFTRGAYFDLLLCGMTVEEFHKLASE